MEGVEAQQLVSQVATAPTVQTSIPPTIETSYSEGGALGSITNGKMNIKDIVIGALLITMSIYVIVSSRKTMQKLDEQLSNEEIDDIYARLDEHEENLKRAMGKNYKTN
jgi:hypothetical protein